MVRKLPWSMVAPLSSPFVAALPLSVSHFSSLLGRLLAPRSKLSGCCHVKSYQYSACRFCPLLFDRFALAESLLLSRSLGRSLVSHICPRKKSTSSVSLRGFRLHFLMLRERRPNAMIASSNGGHCFALPFDLSYDSLECRLVAESVSYPGCFVGLSRARSSPSRLLLPLTTPGVVSPIHLQVAPGVCFAAPPRLSC